MHSYHQLVLKLVSKNHSYRRMCVIPKLRGLLGIFSVSTYIAISILVLINTHTPVIATAAEPHSSYYTRPSPDMLLPIAAAAVSQSLAAGTEPSWLLGWQQLQQQRMDRLSHALQTAAAATAAKQPSAFSWSLISLVVPDRFNNRDLPTWDDYIRQQRPTFAARDLDQFLSVLYPIDQDLDVIMIQHGLIDSKHQQGGLQTPNVLQTTFKHDKGHGRHSSALKGSNSWKNIDVEKAPYSQPGRVPGATTRRSLEQQADVHIAGTAASAASGGIAATDSSDLDELLAAVKKAATIPEKAKLRRLMSTASVPAPKQAPQGAADFVTPEFEGFFSDTATSSTSSSDISTPGMQAASDPVETGVQAVNQPGPWQPAATAVAAAGEPRQQNAWAYRIVGGQEAPINRYKWACSLRAANDFHYCGCSLIAPSVVLTAAHCLDHGTNDALSKPWVEIGRHYLNGSNRTEGNDYDRIKCETSAVHQGWSYTTGLNDIALCFLETSSRFSPIKIAEAANSLSTGKELTVMGWGASSEGARNAPQLMEVKVNVVDSATCNTTYQNAIRTTQICAGVPAGGADACQGDSGGPLIVAGEDAADDLQVGIVSYGVGCGRPNTPGVYTDISEYRDFIKEKMLANSVSYKPLTGSGTAAPPAADEEDSPPSPDSNSSSSTSDDPCSCTTDGVSGGVNVGLIGCKQHGLDQGDINHYCYTQGGRKCESATASTAYPGAAWQECTSDSDSTAVAASNGASEPSSSGNNDRPSVVGGVVASALQALQGWMFNAATETAGATAPKQGPKGNNTKVVRGG